MKPVSHWLVLSYTIQYAYIADKMIDMLKKRKKNGLRHLWQITGSPNDRATLELTAAKLLLNGSNHLRQGTAVNRIGCHTYNVHVFLPINTAQVGFIVCFLFTLNSHKYQAVNDNACVLVHVLCMCTWTKYLTFGATLGGNAPNTDTIGEETITTILKLNLWNHQWHVHLIPITANRQRPSNDSQQCRAQGIIWWCRWVSFL